MDKESKRGLIIGLLLPVVFAVSILVLGILGYRFVGKTVFWVLAGLLFLALGIWKLPKK
jgi:hypothetical protein